MAHLLRSVSLIAVLTVSLLVPTRADLALIGKICAKTSDPGNCNTFFKNDGASDVYGLLQKSTEATWKASKDALATIEQHLLPAAKSNPVALAVVEQCKAKFIAAEQSFGSASQLAKAKQVAGAQKATVAGLNNVNACDGIQNNPALSLADKNLNKLTDISYKVMAATVGIL